MKTLDEDFPMQSLKIVKTEGLELLRKPFPEHQISVFPRNAGSRSGLSYVGHAALTDRLLDADIGWTWEPVSVDEFGAPMLDADGGMWIRLTVCGVTRLGYGDAQGKTGSNATKERIGDALRNAAMRFGAALDLWHKGELHVEDDVIKTETKEAFKSEPKSEWDKLNNETQELMINEAMAITVMTSDGDIEGAYKHLESLRLEADYKVAFWSRLDSKQRSAIKAYSSIVHAANLDALEKAWNAVPNTAKAGIKSAKDKRKDELLESQEEVLK